MIPATLTVARGIRIDIDPEVARRNKVRRDRRVVTVVQPALRLIGLQLITLVVFLYGQWIPGSVAPGHVASLALFNVAYSLVSWVLLRRYYRIDARIHLGVVFLTIDLLSLNLAIYVTGATESWLLPLLLARAADQALTTFRRTLLFAHASVASYALLVAYVALVEQRPVAMGPELTKLAVLYTASIYLSLVARVAERVRQRTGAVINFATQLLKRLEDQAAQLQESSRRAEEASRAKSEFLARMSHELRTPLHAIIGLSSVLADSGLSEEQHDSVVTIQTSANHLLGLISDVLDFSRIEAGRLALERTPFDVRRTLQVVAAQLRPTARNKHLDLEIEIDASVPPSMLGDPLRTAQIVMNLAANAVKFTERGGVRLRASAEDGWLHLLVEDTGIGIAPDVLPRLFEEFSQADGSTTRRFGGTGLGLAISQRLARAMGGRIEVRSQVGQGSTFTVHLPCVVPEGASASQGVHVVAADEGDQPATTAPPGAERTPALPHDPAPRRLRVLVAEDNVINQKVATKLLSKLGCEVTVAANGLEACEAIEREQFHLVLMDCQMPVMDGFEATARIRQNEPPGRRLPIIALTANATTEDRDRCLACGMDDYLAKPVRIDELRAITTRWVA